MVAGSILTGDVYYVKYILYVTVLRTFLPSLSPKSNLLPNLPRAKNRSTPLSSGWTTPRLVSTSGSVRWNTMLSLGWEGQYRRTLHALDSYAWGHASDTGNRRMYWHIKGSKMLLNEALFLFCFLDWVRWYTRVAIKFLSGWNDSSLITFSLASQPFNAVQVLTVTIKIHV